VKDCTRRCGGSTTRFSPRAISIPDAPDRYDDTVVQSEWVWTPKLYFARCSGSVIAAHSFSGVVLM
jgi:hypothetical protein